MSMLLNRCCEAELWCFYFQALVERGREERAHGIMGEVQEWGTVCVCVCERCTVCSRYEYLDLCVSREVYWVEGNEYWLRINAHNLLIENVNCTVNGIFVQLHVFQWLHSPCVQHDAKYGSLPHPCIHLCRQAVITSFVPFTHHSCFFFSPVLCVCVSVSLQFFSCRLSLCQYLLRGSELGGECSRG